VPCMVADDGELIAGHGRVLAATLLGLSEVPVIRLSNLDEAKRRASQGLILERLHGERCVTVA